MSNDDLPAVYFIRLKDGEDVIAETVEVNDGDRVGLTLFNPLKVVYSMTSSGYVQVSFMPWIFVRICDIQEFDISQDDVLLYSPVSKTMNDQYWNTIDKFFSSNTSIEMDATEAESETEHETSDDKERLQEIMEYINENITKRTYH